MLGMGVLLAPRNLVAVVRTPRALLLGLALQLAAVPALAAVLGAPLPDSAGVAAGLILVAAVPGGTMSRDVACQARGAVVGKSWRRGRALDGRLAEAAGSEGIEARPSWTAHSRRIGLRARRRGSDSGNSVGPAPLCGLPWTRLDSLPRRYG